MMAGITEEINIIALQDAAEDNNIGMKPAIKSGNKLPYPHHGALELTFIHRNHSDSKRIGYN